MKCQRCKSTRVLALLIKITDAYPYLSIKGKESEDIDTLPDDLGIGGGDYVEFKYCLDCGQMQGMFPLKETELERKDMTQDEEEVNPMTLSPEDYKKYIENY
jgi:hypothetical protein